MVQGVKRIGQEITGVFLILSGIYIALCLITYSEWDPSPFVYTTHPVENYGGIVGSYLSDSLISAIGIMSFIIPPVFMVYGIKQLLGKEGQRIHLIGLMLLILSSSILLALATMTFHMASLRYSGGFVGITIAQYLKGFLSLPGAYIFALALWLSSIIILSPVSLVTLVLSRPGGVLKEEAEQLSVPPPSIREDAYQTDEGPIIHDDTRVKEVPVPAETTSPVLSQKSQRIIRADGNSSDKGDYELPGVELLTPPDLVTARSSRDELFANSALLEKKLRDFDVEGKVIQVHPGPVVTMYEFEPAPGIKINRVVSLSDDLALSLKAQSVRVSTLSGKAAIGIEVPNRNRETVRLGEIISSEHFVKSYSMLTLALGKDIFGNPVVTDLSRMPHLLVAGATGAGKSVSINSMVMSILFKATPRDVKMLMIDPKLLELSAYERIPHLITPVITAPKQAAAALRKMVLEMERRYHLLAERGVRNIESFNRVVPVEEQIPYIVIFIDELADLMFASANEVEDSIARLAQMARASGIHLILATQRPSVDVITGVIKANFPARIAFQVTSRIDSRTIIDAQGAEQLLGKGDMLLMLPGVRIMRVHGALVTEEEIKRVTEFITSQGSPDYSIFENIQVEEQSQEFQGDESDDIYQKVQEFGEAMGEVSISSIQRRFKIGYNRAARMMELLEEDGLVGPPKGAGKPRDFIGRRRS